MDLLGNGPVSVLLLAFGLIALILLVISIVHRLLCVCEPHEALVLSGHPDAIAAGRHAGFRLILCCRVWRIPIVERVGRMDLRLLSVSLAVAGAYSKGGIPLKVLAHANVKVSSEPTLLVNAIERFLGRERDEIARVAKETLEGHLRALVATMEPEAVSEDRLTLARHLQDEARADLQKLGLQLDTLKIQHVADERGYLDSIGRTRAAEMIRQAQIEADETR